MNLADISKLGVSNPFRQRYDNDIGGRFVASPKGEYFANITPVTGQPFYIGSEQFAYWAHTQLIIDVVAGNGGMFSLDNGTGQRFLTRSRLFSEEELQLLPAPATGAPPDFATRPSSGGPQR